MLQAYEGGRLPLFHFDAWMEGREKALFLDGGDDWLHAGGIACVEWAGRVADWLPSPRLEVELAHRGPSERTLRVAVVGEEGPARSALEAALEGALGALGPPPGGPEAPSAVGPGLSGPPAEPGPGPTVPEGH